MPVSFNIPELFEENGVDSLDMAGLKSWFTPKLNPVKMAYIGLRAIDPAEKLLLDKLNIPSYTMREVDDLGIREVSKILAGFFVFSRQTHSESDNLKKVQAKKLMKSNK